MRALAKPLAFLKRDLGVAITYRVSFIESLGMLVFSLLSLDIFARFINRGTSADLEKYGNDYFAYALIGVSIALFARVVMEILPGAIRSAQVMGTLEVIASSRTSLPIFLLGSSIYALAFATFRLAAGILIGVFLLGAQIRLDQVAIAFVGFLLTVAIFAGVGVIAAAFVLMFKQREPFTGALFTASLLLSGVLYPTSALPGWLERISVVLPLTHTTEVMRVTLLQGGGLDVVAGHLIVLVGFALCLPVGLKIFALAVKQVRTSGSTGNY